MDEKQSDDRTEPRPTAVPGVVEELVRLKSRRNLLLDGPADQQPAIARGTDDR